MSLSVMPLLKERHRFFLQRDYAFGYIALSESSAEERLVGNALLQACRLVRVPIQTILDIGCGDGRLARRFFRKAKTFSIYEPNPILFSLAVSRFLQGNCPVNAQNTIFPSSSVFCGTLNDFIILSHVLYHVERNNWMEFFDVAARTLNVGGVLAVNLWNQESEVRYLSSALVPGRWLCSAEDLLEETTNIERMGLTKICQMDIYPCVKAHSREMAKLITSFLVGSTSNFNEHSLEINIDIERRLYLRGLINSQTLVIFRKDRAIDD